METLVQGHLQGQQNRHGLFKLQCYGLCEQLLFILDVILDGVRRRYWVCIRWTDVPLYMEQGAEWVWTVEHSVPLFLC